MFEQMITHAFSQYFYALAIIFVKQDSIANIRECCMQMLPWCICYELGIGGLVDKDYTECPYYLNTRRTLLLKLLVTNDEWLINRQSKEKIVVDCESAI